MIKRDRGFGAEEKPKRKINVKRNVTEPNLLQQSPKKRSIAASWFQNHYQSVVMQRLRTGQIFTSSPTKQQENRAWPGLRSKRRCRWFGSRQMLLKFRQSIKVKTLCKVRSLCTSSLVGYYVIAENKPRNHTIKTLTRHLNKKLFLLNCGLLTVMQARLYFA